MVIYQIFFLRKKTIGQFEVQIWEVFLKKQIYDTFLSKLFGPFRLIFVWLTAKSCSWEINKEAAERLPIRNLSLHITEELRTLHYSSNSNTNFELILILAMKMHVHVSIHQFCTVLSLLNAKWNLSKPRP